ncbi:hypothetical protein RHJ30_12845, partial [Thermosynechococcus sp. TG252]|nr:hypothetical protein [Thermosynechococcus sp. TG252]
MASFATLVKSILNRLSPCDYPVLNSQLFFKIWLTYVLDQGLTSMRALFYQGIPARRDSIKANAGFKNKL